MTRCFQPMKRAAFLPLSTWTQTAISQEEFVTGMPLTKTGLFSIVRAWDYFPVVTDFLRQFFKVMNSIFLKREFYFASVPYSCGT